MKRALLVGMGLVLVGGVVTPVVTPMGADSASAATRVAMAFDFDGDGYADLAIGVPGEDLKGKPNAGAVQVLYGSDSGVTDHDQFWHQGRKGVKGAVEAYDKFGFSLDSADFNSDGYADLAIGIPREDLGGVTNVGAVQVLYGSPAGLTAVGDQMWHQGAKGVPGSPQKHDRFGDALAAGDVNGDGYADLAVGVAGEDIRGYKNAGRVLLLRGSEAGLTASGAQNWNQGSPGVASLARAKEWFGDALALGDVTGDGRDDLVVQVWAEKDTSTPGDRGSAVHVLPGSSTGLTASGSQYFGFAALGLPERASVTSLRLGDVDADGRSDLAMGVARLGVPAVVVLHGHANGLHPSPLAEPGEPGQDTMWPGWSGVSGDFSGDGYADLVLDARSMVVGTRDGLGSDVVVWQAIVDAQRGGGGSPLSALPLSGGSHTWLVIGGPGSAVGSAAGAGMVSVLRATGGGLPGPVTDVSQDSARIKNVAEDGDAFGFTVGDGLRRRA